MSRIFNGSQTDWPLGILEAKECEYVALAQGMSEFLTLHQYVVQEKAQDRVAPVGMLPGAHLISPEALSHFKGKHVRIYPSLDKAVIKASESWPGQLHKAGARKVEIFNFPAFRSFEGNWAKNLVEFNRLKLARSGYSERTILP